MSEWINDPLEPVPTSVTPIRLRLRSSEMSEWISVEDRLPAERNKWGSCIWLVKPMHEIPTTAIFDANNGNWYSRATAGGTHKIFVTHWMSLPELPDSP